MGSRGRASGGRVLRRASPRTRGSQSAPWDSSRAGRRVLACARSRPLPGPAGVRVWGLAGAAGRRTRLPSRRPLRAARALAAAPAPRGLGRAGEGDSGGKGGRREGSRAEGGTRSRRREGGGAAGPAQPGCPTRDPPKASPKHSPELALQKVQLKALGTVTSDITPAAGALRFTGAGTEGTQQPQRVAAAHPPSFPSPPSVPIETGVT